MMQEIYELNYAGHIVRVRFHYPETRYMFRSLPVLSRAENPDVSLTSDYLEWIRPYFPEGSSNAFIEYRCLMGQISRFLLREGCCVFHAVAFRWQDRAWLLTAPPGTGKSTQYFNWSRCFPGEIRMISGDMPVVEAREDGSVWVHPSSWNGKENLFGAKAAPLGGTVLLEQGREDRIRPLSVQDDVLPLLGQIMVFPETEEESRTMARLLEQMLRAAPAWKLVNLGGDDSTRLLRQTLLESLGT